MELTKGAAALVAGAGGYVAVILLTATIPNPLSWAALVAVPVVAYH